MAMGPQGAANINVTPMIDILLVLLVIFMVITPLDPVGLSALVPSPASDSERQSSPATPVVIMVRKSGLEINSQPLLLAQLPLRLHGIFHGRPGATVFIDGEPDLEYGDVARVIDAIHGAGIRRVGLMPGKRR